MHFTPDDVAKASLEVAKSLNERQKAKLLDGLKEVSDENGRTSPENLAGFIISQCEIFSIDFTTALLQKLAESDD